MEVRTSTHRSADCARPSPSNTDTAGSLPLCRCIAELRAKYDDDDALSSEHGAATGADAAYVGAARFLLRCSTDCGVVETITKYLF